MAKNKTITLDLSRLSKLASDGEKIFFQPEAEKNLLELLAIQEKVEEAIKIAKETLEEAGLKYNKNFTSIVGEKIKVGYRYFGQQYGVDESHLDDLPKDFYKKETKVRYAPVVKEIEKYLKSNKNLPLGIIEFDRKKSITFGKVKQDEK